MSTLLLETESVKKFRRGRSCENDVDRWWNYLDDPWRIPFPFIQPHSSAERQPAKAVTVGRSQKSEHRSQVGALVAGRTAAKLP